MDSPRDIFVAMSRAYGDAKTYVDHGLVSTVYVRDDGSRRTDERPFDIAFVRGGSFRFEFRNASHVYVVWSDGATTLRYWNAEGLSTIESLDAAIAGATGVSGASAHVTPCMLMPEQISGFSLIQLEELVIEGVEDGCWKISGEHRGERTTLWIDQQTFLLRRVYGTHQFAGFRTEATTTFDPLIDEAVSPDLLKPPS